MAYRSFGRFWQASTPATIRRLLRPHHPFSAIAPDPATKAYVAKRIAEGHSKLDAIRSLKRYIAREVFHIIMRRYGEINQTRIAA